MMQIFLFLFFVEVGYHPIGYIDSYESGCTNADQSFYIDFSVEFDFFEIFFIGGEMNVPMYYAGREGHPIVFDPYFLESMFYVGLRYKFVEFGFRHFCSHPVISWMKGYHDTTDMAYESIYLKFYGSVGTKKRTKKKGE